VDQSRRLHTRATSVPAEVGGQIHHALRNRALMEVPLQAKKWHICWSGSFGGSWGWRGTRETGVFSSRTPLSYATTGQRPLALKKLSMRPALVLTSRKTRKLASTAAMMVDLYLSPETKRSRGLANTIENLYVSIATKDSRTAPLPPLLCGQGPHRTPPSPPPPSDIEHAIIRYRRLFTARWELGYNAKHTSVVLVWFCPRGLNTNSKSKAIAANRVITGACRGLDSTELELGHDEVLVQRGYNGATTTLTRCYSYLVRYPCL